MNKQYTQSDSQTLTAWQAVHRLASLSQPARQPSSDML